MSGRKHLIPTVVCAIVVVLWSLRCGTPVLEDASESSSPPGGSDAAPVAPVDTPGSTLSQVENVAASRVRWQSALIGPAPGERSLLFWSRQEGQRSPGLLPLAIAVEQFADQPASIMVYDGGTILDALAKLEEMGYDTAEVREQVLEAAEAGSEPGSAQSFEQASEFLDGPQSTWRLDEEGEFAFGQPAGQGGADDDASAVGNMQHGDGESPESGSEILLHDVQPWTGGPPMMRPDRCCCLSWASGSGPCPWWAGPAEWCEFPCLIGCADENGQDCKRYCPGYNCGGGGGGGGPCTTNPSGFVAGTRFQAASSVSWRGLAFRAAFKATTTARPLSVSW